jgi:hypothetical protein
LGPTIRIVAAGPLTRFYVTATGRIQEPVAPTKRIGSAMNRNV